MDLNLGKKAAVFPASASIGFMARATVDVSGKMLMH
jgi:hypothetical protein